MTRAHVCDQEVAAAAAAAPLSPNPGLWVIQRSVVLQIQMFRTSPGKWPPIIGSMPPLVMQPRRKQRAACNQPLHWAVLQPSLQQQHPLLGGSVTLKRVALPSPG